MSTPGKVPREKTRAEKAWDMRLAGANLKEISDALGYGGGSNVENAITKLLHKPGPARDLFTTYKMIHLERMDMLHRTVFAPALAGDKDMIRLDVMINERQARLLGLDAPARLDITDSTRSEVALALADLEAQMPRLERGTAKGEVVGSSDVPYDPTLDEDDLEPW